MRNFKDDFPILERSIRGNRLTYLDSAATTLKPKCMVDSLTKHYLHETSNIHRGVHFLSEQATGMFESVRTKLQKWIGAKHSEEIIFTRGTTESINFVASAFGETFVKPGDEILITHMEHHSNIVPWQMLCERKNCHLKVLPINDKGELEMDQLPTLLTEKTKLLGVVHVSNSLGTLNPIEEIIKLAHSKNIPVLIDAAQSIAHRPVDVSKMDADFIAFSAHKMFGPTGLGVLYAKKKWLDVLPPFQGGGDMILNVTFEKTTYNKAPHKFEAGTPHIAGVIGLGAAMDYINELGFRWIMNHEKDLLNYAVESLQKIPGLQFIGEPAQRSGAISFMMEGIHPHDLGTIVDAEGVAIRTGHHCTQPVMERFGIPATARASFSVYNTDEDVDQLVKALLKAREVFG